MASFYVSPTGSGSGDGSSIANAVAIGDLPALVSSAGPGATIYLIADQGPYLVTAPIVLAGGGTAGAPITITGVDSAGNPMAAAFVGDRADPYDPAGPSGTEVFRLMPGADNLVFSNLTFENVGNGAFRVGGDIANLTIENVTATNVERFLDDLASGSSTTATISGLTITDVTIHGFSQDAIRIQYDSHDVLIQDVYGDSEFQDGQGFAEGVHILGTAHDITIQRVTMGNALTTEDSYWNGDGFVCEAGAYNIAFIDTLAFGNADAGYDIKSSSTTLTGAVAEGNNRNFRIWAADTILTDVVSLDPHHSGGTASMSSFWFGKNAQATLINPLVSDGGSTLVFDLPNSGATANVTGLTLLVGANAQLARTASSSHLNTDAISRGVAANGDYDGGSSSSPVDVYAVGNGPHQLTGGGAGDTLRGAGGDDDLRGGGGGDVLLGGAGNDVLNGGAGGDTLIGGAGFDIASYVDAGQSVTVSLAGGAPMGGAAGDRLFEIEGLAGSAFADTLTGDSGANWLIGNAGDDTLRGGAGNDLITGGKGADIIDGGAGFDIADYSSSGVAVVVDLGTGTGSAGDAAGDQLTGIEQLIGSGFADSLTGGGGNDVLVGGAGADILNGAGGINTADYSASADGVNVDLAAGTGSGGDAAGDQLSGIENVIGSAFADIIAGDQGGNVLIGGAGDDQLSGNGGNDRLVGGVGADSIAGGAGIDTADYSLSAAAVQVDLALGTGVGGDAQGDQLGGIENLIGSTFGDLLVGDGSANALSGGAGDDRLIGGAGADLLDGGIGTDIADYSASGSAITLNAATGVGTSDAAGDVLKNVEIVVGSTWSDTLTAGGSVRTLDGAGGDDALTGSASDDRLIGGAGADALDGGGGFDRADYSTSAGPVQVDLQAGVGTGGDAQGDSLVNVDALIGSAFGDMLTGDSGDNLLIGGAGGDQLDGGTGVDTADYSASKTAVSVSLTGAPAT
ncbi:MAG: calcium-binding protein, partial [Sphingomicrobium sp.]